MPRDIRIVSATAPTLEMLVDAGAAIDPELRLRTLDGGAVTEIVDRTLTAVLSVGRPELLEVPDEVLRLAPEAAQVAHTPGGVWWIEAWAPWGARGDVGERIARGFAAAAGALCTVEDGA